MKGGGCVFLVCKMQRGEVLCAKWTHLLSLNQIRETVMDSGSNETEYITSGMEDEEVEPHQPLQGSPSS